MNWIIFSILPPFLWSITNYIDKYLIEKYFKKSHGAPLMLLILASGVILLPFVYFLSGGNFSISLIHILIVLLSSIISITSWIIYARTLSESNVSTVVPLFQLMPVFSYILGLLFLGEKLGVSQIVAALIIILGSIFLTLELSGQKVAIKRNIILPMVLTTFLSSLNVFIIKYLMIEHSFWCINFWNMSINSILAITLLLVIKDWRVETKSAFQISFSKVAGMSFLNELLDFGATMLYRYAMLIAPMALVSVLSNGFQPVFVLILAVILSIFFPRLSHEKYSKAELAQRTIAIAVIFIGTFLINR